MNFKKETGHRYKIKNQNGLNNALYDFYNANDHGNDARYSKQEVRRCLQNHPVKYPCKITIIDQMFECRRVFVEVEYYDWFLSKINKWFF